MIGELKVAIWLLVAAFLWPSGDGDVPGEITQTATICADVTEQTCTFGEPIEGPAPLAGDMTPAEQANHDRLVQLVAESNVAIAGYDAAHPEGQ